MTIMLINLKTVHKRGILMKIILHVLFLLMNLLCIYFSCMVIASWETSESLQNNLNIYLYNAILGVFFLSIILIVYSNFFRELLLWVVAITQLNIILLCGLIITRLPFAL